MHSHWGCEWTTQYWLASSATMMSDWHSGIEKTTRLSMLFHAAHHPVLINTSCMEQVRSSDDHSWSHNCTSLRRRRHSGVSTSSAFCREPASSTMECVLSSCITFWCGKCNNSSSPYRGEWSQSPSLGPLSPPTTTFSPSAAQTEPPGS